jgi:hypothetical protein
MNKATILWGALALFASTSLASVVPTEDLSWHPAPGTRVRREIVTRHNLTPEVMRMVTNGVEQLSQRPFDLKTEQVLTVTDTLSSSEGGRPTKLRRYYDASSFRVESDQSRSEDASANLVFEGAGSVVGKGVTFTWVPEDKEYGRYFDTVDGIEEILPDLSEDLSLRSLLPAGPVAPGDTWELKPSVLGKLFGVGGKTNYDMKESAGYALLRTMRLGIGLHMESIFGAEGEGKVNAMFTGTEEVQGRKLALIYLTFDVDVSRDMSDLAGSALSPVEMASGFRVESATVKLALKGSGILRWDLKAGHLYDTRDLHAAERVSTRLIQVREGAEGPESFEQELTMVGAVTHSSVCIPEK